MPLPLLQWLADQGLSDTSEVEKGIIRIDPKISGVGPNVPLPLARSQRDVAIRLTEMDTAGVAHHAAAVLLAGALVGLRSPMPDTTNLNRRPSAHWPAPQLMFTPDASDGPIMVTLAYQVVGRSRRRTGALRWELFRDGGEPTRFIESFLIGTWAEYVRQRENRLTGADRRFEEQARRYAIGEPVVAHLFPPPNGPTKR
jgi:hypothetical protein